MTQSGQKMQSQVEGLATLLVLDDETRKIESLREFGFFTTNETHRLIPYHTAWLWQISLGKQTELLNQSGTAELDPHAPVNQWMRDRIRSIQTSEHALELFQTPLATEDRPVPDEFVDILPPNLLWCPLLDSDDRLAGGLVFTREMPFSEQEIKMLRWLLASYQYTWIVLTGKQSFSVMKHVKEKKILVAASCLLLAILFFPVHLSVLGTATVIPRDPLLVNAPMQGVIRSFAVSPGDHVKAGDLLFSLDKTDLESDMVVSQRELQLTEAKLRTAVNQNFAEENNPATQDPSSAQIPVLKSQLNIDQAHVDYTKRMLEKADVRTPISGIVVFDSKDEWIGQPVQTGERILVVANPDKVQLKIDLPVSNAIRIEPGASGDFFVYGQLSPVRFSVKSIGYNARLTPAKIFAYPIEAQFTEDTGLPQLGAEGTARIYGHRAPLVYYLLRRPLQVIRQTLGM